LRTVYSKDIKNFQTFIKVLPLSLFNEFFSQTEKEKEESFSTSIKNPNVQFLSPAVRCFNNQLKKKKQHQLLLLIMKIIKFSFSFF